MLEFFAKTTFYDKQIYIQVQKNSIDKNLIGDYFGFWWYVYSDYIDHRLDMLKNKPDEFFKKIEKNYSGQSGYANLTITKRKMPGVDFTIIKPVLIISKFIP